MLKTRIRTRRLISGLRAIAVLTTLLLSLSVQASQSVASSVLYFDESEVGVEPYLTRFIIADDILRIDDGRADGSYILFNAVSGTLYSVTRSEQSVLKIPLKRELEIADLYRRFQQLDTRLITVDDKLGPKVAGIQSVEYELKVGKEVCTRFSSVEGLLEAELELLIAYERALVANNTGNIVNQPEEYISDCMLANELFAADLYLSKGFPMMIMENGGVQRFLKNYKQGVDMDKALFDVPKGYLEFTLDDKIGL